MPEQVKVRGLDLHPLLHCRHRAGPGYEEREANGPCRDNRGKQNHGRLQSHSQNDAWGKPEGGGRTDTYANGAETADTRRVLEWEKISYHSWSTDENERNRGRDAGLPGEEYPKALVKYPQAGKDSHPYQAE